MKLWRIAKMLTSWLSSDLILKGRKNNTHILKIHPSVLGDISISREALTSVPLAIFVSRPTERYNPPACPESASGYTSGFSPPGYAPICLPISCSSLPAITNKTPRYLNSFTWGSITLPHPERAVHCFMTGNHGLSPLSSLNVTEWHKHQWTFRVHPIIIVSTVIISVCVKLNLKRSWYISWAFDAHWSAVIHELDLKPPKYMQYMQIFS